MSSPRAGRKSSRKAGSKKKNKQKVPKSPRTSGSPVTPRSQGIRSSKNGIGEGSILELDDNNTVCSDITDAFSIDWTEASSPHQKNRKKRPDLGKINEAEDPDVSKSTHVGTNNKFAGTSWAELSMSEKTEDNSKRRAMHLNKRWGSVPNLDAAAIMKTPVRGDKSQEFEGGGGGQQTHLARNKY